MAQIRGEPVEPELVEISRPLIIERDRLRCSWCDSPRLSLAAVASLPDPVEPDRVGIWLDCRECGVRFMLGLEESPSGIRVSVEEA